MLSILKKICYYICMKTENIKLAIFDIDDTLIKRGKIHIEESALKGINKLKEKGIEILIATGRAYYFIQDDVHDSIKPNYYVTTNGASVYDENKNIIFKIPMVLEEVQALVRYAKENHLGVALKMYDNMPVYNDLNIFKTVYMQGSPKQHILEDLTNIDQVDMAPLGVFMMGDENLIEASRPLSPNGFYAKAYENAYDIYSKEAGKIKGIEFVLNQLDISWDEAIAFGDAANDMEMIQKAHIGVAMGNSTFSLKEKADYTTSDIEDDGIYRALKHFNLI